MRCPATLVPLLVVCACTSAAKVESSDAGPQHAVARSESVPPSEPVPPTQADVAPQPPSTPPPVAASPPARVPAALEEQAPSMTVSALGTQVVVDPTDCPFEVTSVALPAINAAGTSFVYTEHMWDSTSEDSAFSFSAVWRPIGRKRRLERSRIYRADKSSDKRTRNPCAAQHRAATKAAAQINTRLRKQKFHALAALDVDRVFPQEEQLSPNWPRGGQSAARKLPPKKRPVRARLHHDEFSLELPGSDLLRQPVDLERGHRRVCHGDPFVITVWGDRTLGVIVLEYEVESATCNMPGFIPFKVADEVFAQIESRPTSVLRTTG